MSQRNLRAIKVTKAKWKTTIYDWKIRLSVIRQYNLQNKNFFFKADNQVVYMSPLCVKLMIYDFPLTIQCLQNAKQMKKGLTLAATVRYTWRDPHFWNQKIMIFNKYSLYNYGSYSCKNNIVLLHSVRKKCTVF